MSSQNQNVPLPLRSQTLLGVCEALGQDFGVNPTWFRMAFIAPLFFFPLWTVAAYFNLQAFFISLVPANQSYLVFASVLLTAAIMWDVPVVPV